MDWGWKSFCTPVMRGAKPPTAVHRAANQNSLIASVNHTIIYYGSALTPLEPHLLYKTPTISVNIFNDSQPLMGLGFLYPFFLPIPQKTVHL